MTVVVHSAGCGSCVSQTPYGCLRTCWERSRRVCVTGVAVGRSCRMRSSSPERYPSDLTDQQWVLIEPMVPVRPGGRPAIHSRRRIVEAILYVNRTGCSWRQLPHDFPPWDTVYWYFQRWNAEGTTDRIHDALRAAVRDHIGRDPMASAAIVDAQSVKGADTVPAASRGFDAGKKVNGRKRHVVVDTLGLLVVVLVTAASLQDATVGGWCWPGPGWRCPPSCWCGLMAATPGAPWPLPASSCGWPCRVRVEPLAGYPLR
jgi:transposase